LIRKAIGTKEDYDAMVVEVGRPMEKGEETPFGRRGLVC